MLKLTVWSVTLAYVIMTSNAMPRSHFRVSDELSSGDQSRDATVNYYEPLNAILHGLRELKFMQSHPQREIIRYTTTTTKPTPRMKRGNRLSINQELQSLANLLMMRENKRRQVQETKLRSRLMSIGKRSGPQIEDGDGQGNVIEETPVLDRDFTLLTKLFQLFPEISEKEMVFIIDQFLERGEPSVKANDYQGQERLPYEI